MAGKKRACCLSLGVMLAGCANISVERIPFEPTHSDKHIEESDASAEEEDAAVEADLDAELEVDAAVAESDAGTKVEDAQVGGDASTGNVDASAGGANDAGASRPDAGSADAGASDGGADGGGGHDAGTSPCGGRAVFGLCWYLGDPGDSCNETCVRNGGFDPRAVEYVGTSSQGGSLAECTQILRALGISATVSEGKRSDSLGAGCHLWTDGGPWWLDDPSERFGPGEDALGFRIACACDR